MNILQAIVEGLAAEIHGSISGRFYVEVDGPDDQDDQDDGWDVIVWLDDFPGRLRVWSVRVGANNITSGEGEDEIVYEYSDPCLIDQLLGSLPAEVA
jgi:hypothetical protein